MTLAPIQVRRGTKSTWEGVNPVLAAGEPGYVIDTGELRIGDGGTAWNSLVPYATATDVAETVVKVGNQTNISGTVSVTATQSRSTYLKYRLTGNTVITLTPGITGLAYSCTLEIQQDGTGLRTLVLANTQTTYGMVIPISTAANAVDIIQLMWNGSVWRAFLGGTAMSIPAAWVM